jgi:hypothetical protein
MSLLPSNKPFAEVINFGVVLETLVKVAKAVVLVPLYTVTVKGVVTAVVM